MGFPSTWSCRALWGSSRPRPRTQLSHQWAKGMCVRLCASLSASVGSFGCRRPTDIGGATGSVGAKPWFSPPSASGSWSLAGSPPAPTSADAWPAATSAGAISWSPSNGARSPLVLHSGKVTLWPHPRLIGYAPVCCSCPQATVAPKK